ncbi:LamB/YcsF family protein [Nakamurella endophytica]|uniref:LamB/YcsF family protein n=1 Tax=Nakamurella endophytica TaxID=1748367 RepID=UPI001E40724E|nr:5-oxoprolinase subunit PxpA [Nakamurella endophytica]
MDSTAPGRSIDLNSDLAESFGRWTLGDDDAMLALVSSANVACGFHAGDPLTILAALRTARDRGVAVGAHVAYRDLAGFGRRDLDASPDELYGDVVYQLGALAGLARAAGTRVHYVKPHGALYNRIARDPVHAGAVVAAVADVDRDLPVLGLPGSVVLDVAAEAGLTTWREAFADRAYRPDGTLASRRDPGAVVHDPDEVAARALRMATEGTVVAVDGTVLDLRPDSLCLHSDTPGAVQLATAVRAALDRAGVRVAPLADGVAPVQAPGAARAAAPAGGEPSEVTPSWQ